MENLMYKRIIALCIDTALIVLPIYTFFQIGQLVFGALVWQSYTVLVWVSFFMMECFFFFQHKSTLGKKFINIQVLSHQDQPIALEKFLIRTIVKSSSLFLFNGIFGALSLLYMIFDMSLSIHDKVAGTKVCAK